MSEDLTEIRFVNNPADPKTLSLEQLFKLTNIFPHMGGRTEGFCHILRHLEQYPDCYILETGTTRGVANWGGDGQSTLIWDWAVKQKLPNLKAISIDKDSNAVVNAKRQTQHIKYMCDCSVHALSIMDKSIINKTMLLYMDSLDWGSGNAIDSQLHHMCELTCVWSYLPHGCMIVIDDRHDDETGKHAFVLKFMKKIGIEPIFKGYQIGWVKRYYLPEHEIYLPNHGNNIQLV